MRFAFAEQYADALQGSKFFREEKICKGVLVALREGCTRAEFLPYLLVCRQFNYLGSFILYSHVVLTNSSLPDFVRCMTLRDVPKALPVKSLTLRLGTQDPHIAGSDSGIHPALNTLLFKMSEILLRDCRRLRTLSMYIDNRAIAGQHRDSDYIELEPTFNYDTIVCLLGAIPKTCKHLELDTAGIEGYIGNEHLCGHIARLMPELHHVRLRMRNLCSQFLEIPAENDIRHGQPLYPRLRSLVIDSDILVGATTVTMPCPQAVHENSLHAELAPFLHRAVAKGSVFPSLKRLQIFSREVLDDGFGTAAVRVTDIIKYESQMLPNFYIPNYMENDPRRLTWRYIRTIDDKDIIAPRAKAMEIVEKSWRSTTEGTRLPVDAKIQALEIDGPYKLLLEWERDPPIIDLPTYITTQKTLFGFSSYEYAMLSRIKPSYYTSQAFLGIRELPDLFNDPVPKGYFNQGHVLRL